jgi:tetratricopeptide (TPR) repeat protein
MVNRIAILVAVAALGACAPPPPRRLAIPESMLRRAPAPPSTRDAGAPSAIPPNRYVLRLAEGGRVWELELPEQAGGYEVKVPLAGMGPAEMLTPADEELLSDAVASLAKKDGEEARPAASVDAREAAGKKSYLGGLAKISELYKDRRYELALVEAVNLEAAYPRDARVVAMKGSLYLKLGKKRLAREAWQRALTLDPSDAGIAEALRELGDAEE